MLGATNRGWHDTQWRRRLGALAHPPPPRRAPRGGPRRRGPRERAGPVEGGGARGKRVFTIAAVIAGGHRRCGPAAGMAEAAAAAGGTLTSTPPRTARSALQRPPRRAIFARTRLQRAWSAEGGGARVLCPSQGRRRPRPRPRPEGSNSRGSGARACRDYRCALCAIDCGMLGPGCLRHPQGPHGPHHHRATALSLSPPPPQRGALSRV